MIKLVYNQTLQYALKHNEIDFYRESREENIKCRDFIEKLVEEEDHYNNLFNYPKVIQESVSKFGLDRVKFILANTVRELDWDGRISVDNKEWAKTIPAPAEENIRGIRLFKTHSVFINAMVEHIRTVYPVLLNTLIDSYED